MLLVDFRERYGVEPVQETADRISPLLQLSRSHTPLVEVLQSMLEAGHRYKFIDKTVGAGSCLLLGQRYPETS